MNMTMKMMMMKMTWIFSKHQLFHPGGNEVWKTVSFQPFLIIFNDSIKVFYLPTMKI